MYIGTPEIQCGVSSKLLSFFILPNHSVFGHNSLCSKSFTSLYNRTGLLDGVFLALHGVCRVVSLLRPNISIYRASLTGMGAGSMVADDQPDVEGGLLSAARQMVGNAVRICASLDLHCNVGTHPLHAIHRLHFGCLVTCLMLFHNALHDIFQLLFCHADNSIDGQIRRLSHTVPHSPTC